MRYEVQHDMLSGWANTWTDCGTGKSRTFATRKEAKAELDEFFRDIRAAVKRGDMAVNYRREEFRVVPVK